MDKEIQICADAGSHIVGDVNLEIIKKSAMVREHTDNHLTSAPVSRRMDIIP